LFGARPVTVSRANFWPVKSYWSLPTMVYP
jgi:hypothetical protein